MSLSPPPPLGQSAVPPGTYDGEVVIVTGGGTGIGRGMALEFARVGARIVILSRKPEHLQAGVEAIRAIGGEAMAVRGDIRDADSIAAAFDQVEAAFGPASVLVNNAAGNFPVPAERMSPNAWRTVVDIVLNGTFLCSREFALRRIAAGRGGAILNIAATYAWTGGPGTAHSAAAKAGVVNMTQSLAVEWAPDDIRVNGIAPGLFPHGDHPDAMKIREPVPQERTIPGGRTGEMREMGWAATFLCSPYARYITGHTLVVDGANWLRRGLRMPEFTPIREVFGDASAR